MLPIVARPLIVQVQGKVSHLLLVLAQGKVGASLANDHREPVAVAWPGTAAVALLVQVAKGLAQAVEQTSTSVPAKPGGSSKLGETKSIWALLRSTCNGAAGVDAAQHGRSSACLLRTERLMSGVAIQSCELFWLVQWVSDSTVGPRLVHLIRRIECKGGGVARAAPKRREPTCLWHG